MQIAGELVLRRDLLNAFLGMAKVFAQPKVVAGFKTTAGEHLPHAVGAALVGIGENSQRGGALSGERGLRLGVLGRAGSPTWRLAKGRPRRAKASCSEVGAG